MPLIDCFCTLHVHVMFSLTEAAFPASECALAVGAGSPICRASSRSPHASLHATVYQQPPRSGQEQGAAGGDEGETGVQLRHSR